MLMYKIGGLYCDLDMGSLNSMNTLIEENKDYNIILFCDASPSCENAILISKPNIEFWNDLLQYIFSNLNSGIASIMYAPSLAAVSIA